MVERAGGADHVRRLTAVVEELPRISRVRLLDGVDRLVHQRKRDLGGDGVAVHVAGEDRETSPVARLVRLAIGNDLDVEELLHRRNDDLLAVHVHLPVADHDRMQVHVGNVSLPDRNVDELHRPGHVNEAALVQVVALDAEQHPPIVGGHAEHDHGVLAGTERVGVHDDLDAALVVAQLGTAAIGDPHRGLGVDRGARVLAAPGDPVIPLVAGDERDDCLTRGVRPDDPGENFLGGIPAELHPPGHAVAAGRRRERAHAALRLAQCPAGNLATGRVGPDLHPALARHLDDALDSHRRLVGVEGLDLDLDGVAGTVEIVGGFRVHVVPLPRHPHGVRADDLAPRGVGDAGLDGVLEILAAGCGRLEGDRHAAGVVGGERLAFDDLAGAPPPRLP